MSMHNLPPQCWSSNDMCQTSSLVKYMDKLYGKVLDGKCSKINSNNSYANFSILIFKMNQWNNRNGNQRYCKY